MENFNFKGITAEASVTMARTDYKDDGRKKTRFERCMRTRVSFWQFNIDDDLFELSFVKSALIYFIHAAGKRSSKDGGRIELAKTLEHETQERQSQRLSFVAKQKNNQHFLHITFTEDDEFMEEIYLDVPEVLMLDIAMTKIINLMSPYEFDFAAELMGR